LQTEREKQGLTHFSQFTSSKDQVSNMRHIKNNSNVNLKTPKTPTGFITF